MTSAPFKAEAPNLFNPPGVTWHPIPTKLATARILVLLLVGLPILALTLGLNSQPGVLSMLAPAAVFLILLWLVWLIRRQVRAIAFAERDEDLLVRRGILFKRLSIVPYGRMQFVDVHAGPLDRMFGIAKVKLHTASPSSNATIPGLTVQEADRLRDVLTARGHSKLAGL